MNLDHETLTRAIEVLNRAEQELIKSRRGDISVERMQELVVMVARSSAYIALHEYVTKSNQRSGL